MKLEEILQEWKADSAIDKTELADESINIPKLHHKYLTILSEEALLLRKLTSDFKILNKNKWQYYLGLLSDAELKRFGWEPILFKILKNDVQIYLDGDEDLITLKLKVDYQEQKVKMLEEIIKSINARNFIIKNCIEWVKFQHGQ